MFGYIRPCKAELRVKELDAFRAVYCGLCRQLGKSFGAPARLTLNYDFVFLAMLSYAHSGSAPEIKRGRCVVNPLVRVPICGTDEVMAFCADTAALMIYYNLLDKIDDGGVFSKAAYSTLRPFAAHARNKAAKRWPDVESIIKQLYHSQREAEADKDASLDHAAAPTAAALGSLSALLSDDPQKKRVLERFGYMLGRYIYLADALNDLERDIKTGSFNPLAGQVRESGGGDKAVLEARDYARQTLLMTAGEAGLACGLLELKVFEPIIHNIVYLGLAEQAKRIYDKKGKGSKLDIYAKR